MTPEAWRANVAGFVDGADVLLREVQAALSELSRGKKMHVPPAMIDNLAEARKLCQAVSGWIVDPANTGLENGR